MHTAENMVQNDGARLVTLTLALSTELPYTIGEPSSVTIRVLDDDTAPAAPMNLRAASGDRRATLTWDAPSAGIAIEKYQERHALRSASLPSTWTDIPSSAGEDREYTVTGLTNDSQYTFEVRAVNGSLQGSASTVMATPREHGVCIEPSDIAEGESATVTILPQGAPFTTTRVISVVLPSAGGDDKPRKGTDFTVSAPGRSLTPSPGTDPEGMFTGHHPKYTTQIEPGETTVTLTIDAIENSDPIPQAWAARFGRSAASHVLDALEARLDTTPQSYVRLDGHQLGGSPDVKEAVQRLAPDSNLSLWEEASADSASQNMTVKELLLGSAFHLVSNDGEAATGPRLSAWGRVATSGFDGQEDRLSLNGTVTTVTLGVDGHWEHWLTGVALAYSEGDGSFIQVEAAGGDVDSSLTSVHPYVAYALSDRVKLWGMVGYGSGSL